MEMENVAVLPVPDCALRGDVENEEDRRRQGVGIPYTKPSPIPFYHRHSVEE